MNTFSRTLIGFFVGVVLIVTGVGLLGVSYERYYAGRIYQGVQVLGVNVGGLAVAQAEIALQPAVDHFLNTQVGIVYPDQTRDLVAVKDLGVQLDTPSLISMAYGEGRGGIAPVRWMMIANLRLGLAAHAATGVTVDQNQLRLAVEPLFAKHDTTMKDASFSYDGTHLAVMPSRSGSVIDRDSFLASAVSALDSDNLPSDLSVSVKTTPPALPSEVLAAMQPQAESLVSKLALTGGKGTIVDSTTLADWLVVTPDGSAAKFSWDTTKVSTYVAKTLPGLINSNAATVDQTKAQGSLQQALTDRLNGKTVTSLALAMKLTQIVATPTAGLYPGKYIEVNLTTQRLYQFEGTQLINTYVVSSGKWSTPTPLGTMYVYNHIVRAYSKEHNLYMPWWMALARSPDGAGYNGYGIHELPEWPNGTKEGSNHLGTPVSHGCIRLGVGPAEAMYNWADNGTPVYIHK